MPEALRRIGDRIIGGAATTPRVSYEDNGNGTFDFSVVPPGASRQWQIDGADVDGATGNPQALSVAPGQVVTVLVTPVAQEGEVTLPGSVTPVSIVVPASIDPAEPVEGEPVELVPPQVDGTTPITVELESVEIDGEPVDTSNTGGTLSILGASVSVGALVAVWRATGPGSGNSVTSTATATVAAQPEEPEPETIGWRFGPNSRLENTEGLPAVTQGTVAVGSFIVGTVGAMQRITFRGTSNSVHISSSGLVSFITENSRLNDNALGRPVVPGERINFAWRVDSAGMGVRVEAEDGVVRSGGVGGVVLPASTGTYRIGSHDNGGQQFDGTMLALHMWEDPLFLPPTGTDIATMLDEFFQPDGTPKARDELGPEYAKYGDATEGLIFSAVGSLDVDGSGNVIHGGGAPFSLVGTVENLSGSSGGGEAPTGFVITSDPDADLLSGAAANYTLTDADVLALGETDSGLDSRLSLTVDRSNVVLGEQVYLKIEGLTDEEAATWGFLWEFDTSGEFQFLEPGMPWHTRQRNRAVGHHQTVAWTDADGPGTKTPRVKVIPPAWRGIKGAVLEVNVVNRDREAEHPSARTWIVSNAGFTDAPNGNQIASLPSAIAAARSAGGGRIRLRRGQTFATVDGMEQYLGDGSNGGVIFEAWGPATDPLPVVDTQAYEFVNHSFSSGPDYVLVKDIEFTGTYDVVTGVNAGSRNAFRISECTDWSFHGCYFHNVECAVMGVETLPLGNKIMGIYDCKITAWENYGIFIARSRRICVRGSYVCQDPDALSVLDGKTLNGPVNRPDHGPIRTTFGTDTNVVFCQNQTFTCNGWSADGNGTTTTGNVPTAHQPSGRFGATTSENMNLLLSENYGEGAGYVIGGGSGSDVKGSGFAAMHGCYHVAAANYVPVSAGMTGIWMRDNFFVVPNVLRETKNGDARLVLSYPSTTSNGLDEANYTPTWRTKGVYIFNNTIAWMVSVENSGHSSVALDEIMGPGGHDASSTSPEVRLWDNLLWAPNITLEGETGPRVPDGVYSAGAFGPNPKYRGLRSIVGGEVYFDPQFATPANGAILPLLSGSSALLGTVNTAESPAGALDFFGRIRTASVDPAATSAEVLKPAS